MKLGATLTIDDSDVLLLDARASEEVNSFTEVGCTVRPLEDGTDGSAWIGKKARLSIQDQDGDARAIAGLVTEVRYEVRLGVLRSVVTFSSRLSRLELRVDNRMFRDLEVADIAKKVLAGAGYADTAIDVNIQSPPPKRTHVTQYRETDLAFLERLLHESGISLYVVTDDEGDRIVLTDGDRGDAEPADLPVRDTRGMNSSVPAVSSLAWTKKTAPGKVTLRDYDFTRPKLDLTKTVTGGSSAEESLEVYDYPARLSDPGALEKRAQIALARLRSSVDVVRGDTTAAKLAPGLTFTVKDHPAGALNRKLQVTRTELSYSRGSDGTESVRLQFEARGTGEGPIRPAFTAAQRTVPGLETAFVTGPSGKEISPDEFGRVTFHPHWDRSGPTDDKSSAPTRAMQLGLGGAMLTPRVGWEVVVGFLEGDIDQPLVLGRMSHGGHPPAYSLPGDKTKLSIKTSTTPGGGSANEIRFNDAKGSEEMFIHASKDASTSVGNNMTEKVTVDETRTIGGDMKLAVTGAVTETVTGTLSATIGGSQSIGVATYCVDDVGSLTCTVGGSRTLHVGGDHKRTIKASHILSVGGSSVDVVAGTVSVNCLATRNETISAARILLCAGSHLVNVTGARTESIGAVKAILTAGDHVVNVKGDLKQTVTGAIGAIIKGDRSDTSTAGYTDVAAGAQLMKATNVTIEGKNLLSIVMGASTITLTPASVSIAGTSIKVDAKTESLGVLVDNL